MAVISNKTSCFIYPPEEITTVIPVHYTVLACTSILLSITIPLLEGPFLATIYRHQDVQTKSNILIAMMTIPDLLKAFFTLPLATYVSLMLSHGRSPADVCVHEHIGKNRFDHVDTVISITESRNLFM